MAFPQVASSVATDWGSTAIKPDYPSGCQSGDLIIVFIASDGDNTVFDWDRLDDFTEIFSISNGKDCSLHAAWRKYDGTEGVDFQVDFNEGEILRSIVLRITGAEDPTTTAPEGTTTTGDSATPDPPNYNTTDGTKDYLWIAACGVDRDRTIDSYPYADNNLENESAGTSECSIGLCTDELTGQEQNPGTFGISGIDEWVTATVAVHPAGTGDLEVSVTDTMAFLDSIGNPAVPIAGSVTDTMDMSDAFGPGDLPLPTSATDTMSLSDAIQSAVDLVMNADDTLSFSEALSAIVSNLAINTSDSFTMADVADAAVESIGGLSVSTSDT
jgi:hypothetical protein